ACGTCSSPGQRCAASQAAHHPIASSRFPAPMKNISRCGAAPSSRGEALETCVVMPGIFRDPGGAGVDAGQDAGAVAPQRDLVPSAAASPPPGPGITATL